MLQLQLLRAGAGAGRLKPRRAGASTTRELVVDHLVEVAEEEQPVPGCGQGLEQFPLLGVGVLELVADDQWPTALEEVADHRHPDDAKGGGQQVAVGENGRVCCEQPALGLAAQPDAGAVADIAAVVGDEPPREAVEGEDVYPVGGVPEDAAAAVQDLGDRGPAECQEEHPVPAPAGRVAAGEVGPGGCGGGDSLAGSGTAEDEQGGGLAVDDRLLLG